MTPYTINDEVHYLSDEERHAVEITGRSSWIDYAANATLYPSPHAVAPLMELRTGKRLNAEPQEEKQRVISTMRSWFIAKHIARSNYATLAKGMDMSVREVMNICKRMGITSCLGHASKMQVHEVRYLWNQSSYFWR